MAYCLTGITEVQPYHNPDEGRNLWNQNFKNLECAIESVWTVFMTGGGSGNLLTLSGGTVTGGGSGLAVGTVTGGGSGNFLALSGGTVTGDTVFTTNVSANTMSLTSTSVAQLIMEPVNAAAPADGSMWFTTSGGTTFLNYQVTGTTKSVELT